ncbi:MAG: YgiT-type zinc finger protein [Deltaproteobacteria bacterium]
MLENISYFCFYCGKKSEIIHKDLRKNLNGKMVLIKNVPLYNCKSCREVFYPNHVIKLLNKLPSLNLEKNEYEFESLINLI